MGFGGNSLLRMFCFFVVGILFGASVVWGQIKDKIEAGCEKTNNKIPQGLIDAAYFRNIIHLEEAFFEEPVAIWCLDYVLPLIGSVRTDNKPNSPFTMLTLGYHTLGIPAVDFWSESRDFFDSLRPPLVAIREAHREGVKLYAIFKDCHKAYVTAQINNADPALQSKKNYTIYTRELLKCVHLGDTIVEDLVKPIEDKWTDRVYKACQQSLSLMMEVLYRSVSPLYYNGNKYKWDYSPFKLMYLDTVEFEMGVSERVSTTFPAYIQNLTKRGLQDEATFLQARLDDIKARLKTPPYSDIYFEGRINELKKVRLFGIGVNNKGYLPFAQKVLKLRFDPNESKQKKQSFAEYEVEWKKEVKKGIFSKFWNDSVIDADLGPDGVEDCNTSTVGLFKEKFFTLSREFLEVEPSSESPYENKLLVRDGKWDWKPAENGLHNMRLAWDLMGAVLEELKCYMKDTYYFDLRQQAINATQRDLNAGALFSGISYSMLQPCRFDYNNEADLVTKYCTAENNEICAPISPFQSQQRPESEHHGGLGLLKPRWIYKVDKKTGICEGRKDYISLMYACRCGFRLDCGDDLGEQITCQLENNDRLRGQCRGGVAYPCKTLPLAPGKHNETCSSGYCHMKKNSCENKPYKYRKHSGGISTMKLVSLNRFLVQLVGALVAARNGGIIIINL